MNLLATYLSHHTGKYWSRSSNLRRPRRKTIRLGGREGTNSRVYSLKVTTISGNPSNWKRMSRSGSTKTAASISLDGKAR